MRWYRDDQFQRGISGREVCGDVEVLADGRPVPFLRCRRRQFGKERREVRHLVAGLPILRVVARQLTGEALRERRRRGRERGHSGTPEGFLRAALLVLSAVARYGAAPH